MRFRYLFDFRFVYFASEKAVSLIAIHAHRIPNVFDPQTLAEAESAQPAALAGRGKALLGTFPTGLGREFALAPDGRTALMPDNSDGRVRAIDLTTLP